MDMRDDPGLRFQQIYDEYRPRILRYLARMVGEGEAEDLTQEVFVKVGRALESFRGESRLSTWIYQIATHAALDRLRPSSRHAGGSSLPLEDIAGTQADGDVRTGESTASSEQRVIRQEMNACIQGIIRALPETHRTVIILSELEGLKDAEIAQILGLSLQTAKMRLHRARVKLRSELESACDLYRDERNELACDRKNPLITSL